MAEKTEDLNLPLSVVSRIIKEALPDGVIVSKEARLAVSRAASVFILHATTFANLEASAHKRKTLTAPDVLAALHELALDDFLPPLQATFLSRVPSTYTGLAAAGGPAGVEGGAGEEGGGQEVLQGRARPSRRRRRRRRRCR